MGLLRGSVSIRGARVLKSRLSTPERIFKDTDDAARYELEPTKHSDSRAVAPLPQPPTLPCLTEPIAVLLTPQRRTPRLNPPVTPIRATHPSPEVQRQIRFAESAVDAHDARTMRKRCVRPSTITVPLSTPRLSTSLRCGEGKCARPRATCGCSGGVSWRWSIGRSDCGTKMAIRPSVHTWHPPGAVAPLRFTFTCRPFPCRDPPDAATNAWIRSPLCWWWRFCADAVISPVLRLYAP
jgi:hypothetical protein